VESPAGTLVALEQKGLVTTWAGEPKRVAAVAPDVALDNLARAREKEIARARALAGDLAQRWLRVGRAMDPHQMIEIVVGRSATLQRAEQIQRTSTEEVLMFDKPPYAAAVDLGNPTERQLLADGVTRYRCLYDTRALEVPGQYRLIRDMALAGESGRVTSGLPMKMVMGDGRTALVPLETSPEVIEVAAVVHPSALLESLRVLFEVLWRQATPLDAAEPATTTRAFDETNRQVLQLLVTGLTDRAIGRQLDLAERTVQRHVQAIMQAYGVRNRLQLGIRLAQNGWG
jgi:DNA-binding CsgD family transcriptional regulator